MTYQAHPSIDGALLSFGKLYFNVLSHASSMDGKIVSWSTTLVQAEIYQQLLDEFT